MVKKKRPRTSPGLTVQPEAEMLTVDQANRISLIGRSYLYEHLAIPGRKKDCWVPVVLIGRHYRIPRRAFLRAIEARMGTATKTAVAG